MHLGMLSFYKKYLNEGRRGYFEGARTMETIPESTWLIYPGTEMQVGFKQTGPNETCTYLLQSNACSENR